MLIFLFLAGVVTVLYLVLKSLLPEMTAKPPALKIVAKTDSFDFSQSSKHYKKIEKLETLLAEKNKSISLLEAELKTLDAQVRAFDKLKNLLDEEIHRLKGQNRMFRSELGLPTLQTQENSTI
jgi:septal ring factor EnvC (AmiA/AmiB activator)